MLPVTATPIPGRIFSFLTEISVVIRTAAILFLVVFSIRSSSAQQLSIGNILAGRLKTHNEQLPQEKVYLQLDKSIYMAGDTIYIAAYAVNAIKNIPGELSHILYIDLISDQQKTIKKLSVTQLVAGFGAANISLPDSLPEGTYHIRAYTNWMRNFVPDFFFTKGISILNPLKNSPGSESPTAVASSKGTAVEQNNYEIGFFPEGGHLINGLDSRIGFKAVDRQGKGVMLSGTIINNSGKTVIDFKSGHAGLGTISIKPIYPEVYSALVTFPDGTVQKIRLPEVEQSGYILSADNSNIDSLHIRIQTSLDLVKKKKMTFMPLSNGVPLFYMDTDLPDQQVYISIPKSKLPGGIIQLSLVNDLFQPVSERLIFNRAPEGVTLDITGIKPAYEKGEDVFLNLEAKDQLGKPVIGSFSMSIIKSNGLSASPDDEQNILSHLLLLSDLKGHVEQPGYYFNNPSAQKDIELDNLMLVQGWTRFSWDGLLSKQATKYTAEQKIRVSGKIKSDSKRAAIDRIPITLLAGELSEGILLDTLTNDQGHFSFYLPDSLGYLPIRIQAKPKNNANYKISLDEYESPAVNFNRATVLEQEMRTDALKTSRAYERFIEQAKTSGRTNFTFKGTNQLKGVVIRDYDPKPKLINSHSANLNGPGAADQIMLAEEIEKLPDLTYLANRFPFQSAGGKYVLNTNNGLVLPEILILVDGIAGLNDLRDLGTSQIESVELLKTAGYSGIYGIRGAGGVLLITTKQGKFSTDNDKKEAPNALIRPGTFSLQKEFYKSNFEKIDESRSLIETIYWKPDIITDKNGHATVSFKAIKALSGYSITVEGVGTKGNLLSRHIN